MCGPFFGSWYGQAICRGQLGDTSIVAADRRSVRRDRAAAGPPGGAGARFVPYTQYILFESNMYSQ